MYFEQTGIFVSGAFSAKILGRISRRIADFKPFMLELEINEHRVDEVQADNQYAKPSDKCFQLLQVRF